MIDDLEIDRLTRSRQFASGLAIGRAWLCVAAGVIVSKKDTGAAKASRINDNVANRHFDGIGFALITSKVQAARGRVDVSNPQPFAARCSLTEAGRKEAARGVMAV